MPEQHMAACTSPKRCLQQEGTCHILGAHSHRNPGAACGQKQRVCFAFQPLTIISFTFNSYPKWLELPQKLLSKYWSFYTGVVFSHTNFSCNLPHHVQGDPKTGVGKRNSSCPRTFQETAQPYFVSILVKILQPHDANDKASTKNCATSWYGSGFTWESYFALTWPMPDQLPSPRVLSSPSDASLGSAAHLLTRLLLHEPDQRTDYGFSSNPAEVSPNFSFCHSVLPQHEAGLKAQGLYNSAVW